MTTIHVALERSEAVLEGTDLVLDDTVPSRIEQTHEIQNAEDAFVQLTYTWLRIGPNGDFLNIAIDKDGLWWLADDPVPFSDLVIWFT
jgi:hypothetical protein